MSWLVRALCRLLFRFRAHGVQVLDTPGPVLLLPNHTSWFDWILVGSCLDSDWKFVTSSDTAKTSFVHRWIMVNRHTFPIDPLSPYGVKRMAEYLQAGGRLVLFPEGRLSRTGSLMKVFDGTGFLLHKTGARVITCYLRGVHRLPFSPNGDRKQLYPRVSAHFSELLTPPVRPGGNLAEARARLTQWVLDRMIEQRFRVEMEYGPATVPEAIHAAVRLHARKVAVQDGMGKVTYRRLEQGAVLLARQWRKLLPPAAGGGPASGLGDQPGSRSVGGDTRSSLPAVGVLLPNANAAPLTLLSLWLDGYVPSILNYTSGESVLRISAELAGLRYIITSRRFVARAKLQLGSLEEAGIRFLYLEDVRPGISAADKLGVALGWIRPPRKPRFTADDTAVVLFTSGSEGVPKGVELTHANLLANIRQMLAVSDMQDSERFFTALPVFHSFGLTAGLLLPLMRGAFVFLYPSPLHYRIVPTVAYMQDCTVLLATNTFLNGYARRAGGYDFRAMRYLFAGAEKVQEATAATWAQRFGVRILEGYGATECSPVISVNTPILAKHGSAGRLLPGVKWRTEPVEGVDGGGRLFVRGPNVMRGYLNRDADEAFQSLDGWYDTGDIARVDEDGFVFLLGRLKRFAKVSGEMVSLTAVEDALAGAFPQFGARFQVAVLARPDEEKGERLVVVTNERDLTPEQVRDAVKARGLSNLCVPREIHVLREIPKLGTGKVNHRALGGMIGG